MEVAADVTDAVKDTLAWDDVAEEATGVVVAVNDTLA